MPTLEDRQGDPFYGVNGGPTHYSGDNRILCPCGAQATHRVKLEVPSLRGVAVRNELRCLRCADRLALNASIDGQRVVEVQVR